MARPPQREPNPAVTAEQTAECYELKLRGWTHRRIAAHLGVSVGTVHNRIQSEIDARVQPLAEEMRAVTADRLDHMRRKVHEVLDRHHVTVSNGKVIYLGNEPLQDDGPVLAAVDRLNRIEERWAKLWGLDAPQQLDIVQEQRIDLDGQLVADALAAAFEALDLSDEQRATALEAAKARLQEAS